MQDQSDYLKAAGLGAIVVLYIHATGVSNIYYIIACPITDTCRS